MKHIVKIAITVATALLAACGDPDPSTNIPTDRFYARFVAEVRADGTSEVRANFFEKDEWFDYEGVYLDGGDTLEVSTEEHSLLFTGGGNHFVGELVSGVAEDTVFQFDLQRARSDFRDAPDSYGTLPAPMDLVLPEPGQEYSIADDELTVAWQWPGTIDDMWLRVEADCLDPNTAQDWWLDEDFTVDIPGDPGVFTVDLSDEVVFEDQCRRYAAVVTLYRGRRGVVDDAYKPNEDACEDSNSPDCEHRGSVSVRQVRSAPIVLTP